MADEDLTLEADEQETATEEELSDDERVMEELKQGAEVQSEDIGTLRRRLTITVPRSIIDDQLQQQLSERRREETVPGFRRGRAPLKLVEKRFGKEIGQELSSRMVLSSYMAVTERDDIKTVGDPMLLVTAPPPKGDRGEPTERLLDAQEALQHIRIPGDGPLVYKCEVDIQPTFELPSLEGIEIVRPKMEVTAEDVDAEVQRMLSVRGHFAPLEEKEKIAKDDLLIVDLTVTAGDKVVMKEENAQLAARDMAYGGILLAGLGKAVIGKKPGLTTTLSTKIPAEYPEPELRGQDAEAELTVHDAKRLVVPQVDADFLDSYACQTEEELRGLIQSELEAYLDVQLQSAFRKQIDEYLLKNTQLDIPQGISTRQTERIVAMRVIEKMQAGVPEADITREIDSLRTSAAEETAQELKLAFIMERIAEDRDISVTEEEVNGVINEIARRRGLRFDRVRDDLMKNDRIDMLHVRIRNDKIRDALIREAKITDAPKPDAPAEKRPRAKATKKTRKKTGTKTAAKKTSKRKTQDR
ncbi:MAG: trigger factor [Phycisphaerales bacterium]|nr:MAG: trigger factor [Phycisphaerales bacterium]